MTFQYSHNNHFYYDLDGVPWATRTSKFQKFQVHVGSIDQEHYAKSNYRQELLRVADMQYHLMGKEPVIFLSGGADSEIVARSFAGLGVKPKCLTVRFENDYNIEEVNEAVAVTDELGLPHEIIDFNVKDFFYSGEAADLCKEIQCSQIAFLVLLAVINKMQIPSVIGCELQLTKGVSYSSSHWYMRLIEYMDTAHMKLAQKINVPIVSEWFSYTPELMLYYLEQPELEELVYDPVNYKLSITSTKNRVLKKLVPELRKKEKATGYEKLKGFHIEANNELADLLIKPFDNKGNGIRYPELVQRLKGYK